MELIETINQLLELNVYDDLIREYYQVTSKKAPLEVEKTDADPAEDEDEEFNRLTDRLNDLAAELRGSRRQRPSPISVGC